MAKESVQTVKSNKEIQTPLKSLITSFSNVDLNNVYTNNFSLKISSPSEWFNPSTWSSTVDAGLKSITQTQNIESMKEILNDKGKRDNLLKSKDTWDAILSETQAIKTFAGKNAGFIGDFIASKVGLNSSNANEPFTKLLNSALDDKVLDPKKLPQVLSDFFTNTLDADYSKKPLHEKIEPFANLISSEPLQHIMTSRENLGHLVNTGVALYNISKTNAKDTKDSQSSDTSYNISENIIFSQVSNLLQKNGALKDKLIEEAPKITSTFLAQSQNDSSINKPIAEILGWAIKDASTQEGKLSKVFKDVSFNEKIIAVAEIIDDQELQKIVTTDTNKKIISGKLAEVLCSNYGLQTQGNEMSSSLSEILNTESLNKTSKFIIGALSGQKNSINDAKILLSDPGIKKLLKNESIQNLIADRITDKIVGDVTTNASHSTISVGRESINNGTDEVIKKLIQESIQELSADNPEISKVIKGNKLAVTYILDKYSKSEFVDNKTLANALTDQKRLERLDKIIENYNKNQNMEIAWDALQLSFGSFKGNKLVRSLIYRKAKSSLTRSSRDNKSENDNSRKGESNKIKDALMNQQEKSFKKKLDNPALSNDIYLPKSSINNGLSDVNLSQKGRPLR